MNPDLNGRSAPIVKSPEYYAAKDIACAVYGCELIPDLGEFETPILYCRRCGKRKVEPHIIPRGICLDPNCSEHPNCITFPWRHEVNLCVAAPHMETKEWWSVPRNNGMIRVVRSIWAHLGIGNQHVTVWITDEYPN